MFLDDLPALVLPPIKYPEVLPPTARKININNRILNLYQSLILPGGCKLVYHMGWSFLAVGCFQNAKLSTLLCSLCAYPKFKEHYFISDTKVGHNQCSHHLKISYQNCAWYPLPSTI